MQNFFSNLTPGGGGEEEGGLPWYLKWAGKGAGIISGGGKIDLLMSPIFLRQLTRLLHKGFTDLGSLNETFST